MNAKCTSFEIVLYFKYIYKWLFLANYLFLFLGNQCGRGQGYDWILWPQDIARRQSWRGRQVGLKGTVTQGVLSFHLGTGLLILLCVSREESFAQVFPFEILKYLKIYFELEMQRAAGVVPFSAVPEGARLPSYLLSPFKGRTSHSQIIPSI